MENILKKITSAKRLDVEKRKAQLPTQSLAHIFSNLVKKSDIPYIEQELFEFTQGVKLPEFKSKCNSLREALQASDSGVIAEFKRKSPSKGWIHPKATVEDIVPQYIANGASACSILANNEFFGGEFSDVAKAAKIASKTPILFKEFIIDEYQIYEARLLGADAILLIAACLSVEECITFSNLAHSIGLEVLLELHKPEEYDRVLCKPDVIGINNRDLTTFTTSIEQSRNAIQTLKEACHIMHNDSPIISESGISSIQDLHELRKIGFRGFLIGELFMKNDSPGSALREFLSKNDSHED